MEATADEYCLQSEGGYLEAKLVFQTRFEPETDGKTTIPLRTS